MSEKRLNKILQGAGVASRRKADELITAGKIFVNGKQVKELGYKVDPKKVSIKVGQRRIGAPDSKITYIVNKPEGYVCSNKRQFSENLIFDLIDEKQKRLFSIGRLDKDAKGLILVTNDGDFANQVIHPRSNISKEYIVKVQSDITDFELKTMSRGVYIDSQLVIPHRVSKIRNGCLKIVLKDGKHHEVKKLLEKANLPLLELKRVRIGNLLLGKLKEGSYKILSQNERNLIFE